MSFGDMVPWGWGKKKIPVSREEFPLTSLWRDTNKVFEDFFSNFGGLEPFFGNAKSEGAFTPAINLTEDEAEFRVSAELPGLDEKDIQLTLSKDSLTITGEKRIEHEKNEGGRYYSERSYGSFQRIIPLSADVDEDKVDASFKKGVLTIRLPKTKEAQKQSKKISIRSA